MRRSLPTRLLLRTVNLYQRLSAHRPSPCRYVPSCSEYAREALETHGAARGTWLSARRLSRCHPFGGFGFDPVPQRDAAHSGRS
jgi:uncharacterized protein